MEEDEVALPSTLQLAVEKQVTSAIMDIVKPIRHALGRFTNVANGEGPWELVVKYDHEKLREIADSHKDAGVQINVAVGESDPATEIIKKLIRHRHDLVAKSVNGQVH